MTDLTDDPMAAIPDGLCPNTRATYAVRVRDTNKARSKLREAFDAFNVAKADVMACQRGEAKALAELVAESSNERFVAEDSKRSNE